MKSVTQRIKEIKQPKGGYINPKDFEITQLDDGIKLKENENINASLIGLVVDYMTRFLNSNNKQEAFKISLLGSRLIKQENKANELLEEINGLNEHSIINACKLCGYDVCYRAGTMYFKNVDEIEPDEDTIFNIKIMIERGLIFFEKYGPIVKDGMAFQGGYTETICAGDADFMTNDTLWDFKVSKNNPTKDHTLQLIIYYLLGVHSYSCDFSNINKIGIFNPRKNIVYQYEIKNIKEEIIKEVESDVIGYEKIDYVDINAEMLTINDIMKQLECSRNMVMKYYNQDGLPLRKENNKYIISKKEFLLWLEEMVRIKKEQEAMKEKITLITIVIVFLILFYLLCLKF